MSEIRRRVCTGARYRGQRDDGSYRFTAATENPIETPCGREILLMSGCDLARYQANPVILDNHNRSGPVADTVIGTGAVDVVDNELIVDITFDEADPQSARVAGKVSRGFIRAVSVGWIPMDREDGTPTVILLRDDEVGEFDGRSISGPASIVTRWSLVEVSPVAVPADEFALARGFEIREDDMKNRMCDEKSHEALRAGEELLAKKKKDEEASDEELTDEELADEEASDEELTDEEKDAAKKSGRSLSGIQSRAVIEQIRQIAPRGMQAIADELVLIGADLKSARKRFLAELRERHSSVGTPEPKPHATGGIRSMSDEDFASAFGRLGHQF